MVSSERRIVNPTAPSTLPRGAIAPGGADPPDTFCRFGKRTLDKMSWLAPLVNNPIGDRLNLELRHEQLFFVAGERVVDDIGYSEKGTRFSEADFGKPILSLEEMTKKGYWFVGRTYRADVMREALRRQEDGHYYNFLSNQCQDWADRLKRTAERVERERGIKTAEAKSADAGERTVLEKFTRRVPPTEPASLVMGVLSLAIGVFALLAPIWIANAFGLVLGLVFIASGLAHISYAFHGRDWRNLMFMCVVGLLYLIAGALYLLNRKFAIIASGTLVAFVLALQGLMHVGLAVRGRPLRRWVGTLVTGLIMLASAIMVWRHWPADGDRFFGLIVGVCLTAGGLGTIWLSWSTRREEDDPGGSTSSTS
jgi:uncharacterized membrane protein HdeD (DUF308 family)